MRQTIWVIGTGLMAIDYAEVLLKLKVSFTVIGRSEDGCKNFEDKTGIAPISGGLSHYLGQNPALPCKVIVAVGIEALAEVSIMLMNYGIKDILLEKPGVGAPSEIFSVVEVAKKSTSNVLLAYNRRFYSSVLKAEEIIKEDGGVQSFCFEFTEWSHLIGKLRKTDVEHNNWFLGNSTHLVDLAFFLCGKPTKMSAFYKGELDWHPASAIFSGAGETDRGSLFSYHANWNAPGRWWVEVLTAKHRLIFKPIEKLQIQEIGSIAINDVDIDDSLDVQFKPGLFLQVNDFLNSKYDRFVTVFEQEEIINNIYLPMSGYSA
jgi:predicted dehydrogenase